MPSSSRSHPEAAGAGASGDLKVKLLWLTVFRTVTTTLLLATTVLRLLSRPVGAEIPWEDSLSLYVIGLVYLLTVVYGLLLRRGRAGASVAYAQILGDVVVASGLVYLTGGPESPFTFTYSLAVVAASILLDRWGALIAAAASSVAFATLTILIQTGLLREPWGISSLTTSRAIFALVSNVFAQFLIAALASYLSRQLTVTGGRLSAREADLRRLASLQRQILNCMPSGLITCGASGAVTFINPAAAAILGVEGELSGAASIEALLPGISHLLPAVRRGELAVETRSGRRILGLSITPLEESEGSPLIVFQDLTELRRMEDELKRADQLAALGKLSAQLAHEIRNPLAAMRGSAQMLSTEGPRDAPSARLSDILVRESDRLSGLVEDFLQFARPPPPKLRAVSLKRLVGETVEMLRVDPLASGLKIDLDLSDVTAQVDPDQLRQVLVNLLRNAFQAAKPDGQVRVSIVDPHGGPQIEIWDSAGSIPPADLSRIFEPFFTTRSGGTGLGLSTAHSIVRAHGGSIQVRSSPERGTEFVIGFPSVSEV